MGTFLPCPQRAGEALGLAVPEGTQQPLRWGLPSLKPSEPYSVYPRRAGELLETVGTDVQWSPPETRPLLLERVWSDWQRLPGWCLQLGMSVGVWGGHPKATGDEPPFGTPTLDRACHTARTGLLSSLWQTTKAHSKGLPAFPPHVPLPTSGVPIKSRHSWQRPCL